MRILVERFDPGKNDTLGRFYIDGKQECYSLEDEPREVKVHGETCIPVGEYEIKFRKELTPLTIKYREKFDWFTWHLEVCNVPNFKYVYIHIGNTEDDSDACLLVGTKLGTLNGKRAVLNSVKAFEKVYKKISAALNREEKVMIKYFTV